MTQLISLVIDEVYRSCTETWRRIKTLSSRNRAQSIGKSTTAIAPHVPTPVSGAMSSTRYATPASTGSPSGRNATLSRSSKTSSAPSGPTNQGPVRRGLKLAETSEKASQIFERYIYRFDPAFPTLERTDATGFRACAHHRSRSTIRRAGAGSAGRKSANRDDVSCWHGISSPAISSCTRNILSSSPSE